MHTRNPWSGGAQGVDGRCNARRRSGAPEAGGGRPQSGGAWAAKTVKRPPQQPATSTTPVHRLLGTANAQTAPAATCTAPAHQRRRSANAETTPAGAQAAAADETQRPDAACEGKSR